MKLVIKGADLYRLANDLARRLLNQFFFKKLLIDIGGVSSSEKGDVVEMIHRLAEESRGVGMAQTDPQWSEGRRRKNPGHKTVTGFRRSTSGGGERTRTADFHVANVALYQLSYTPEPPSESSRAVRDRCQDSRARNTADLARY